MDFKYCIYTLNLGLPLYEIPSTSMFGYSQSVHFQTFEGIMQNKKPKDPMSMSLVTRCIGSSSSSSSSPAFDFTASGLTSLGASVTSSEGGVFSCASTCISSSASTGASSFSSTNSTMSNTVSCPTEEDCPPFSILW